MKIIKVSGEEAAAMMHLSNLCADLVRSDKDFKSVKLAEKSLYYIKDNNDKEAGKAMDELLEHLVSIKDTGTQESLFIERLINVAGSKVEKVFNM